MNIKEQILLFSKYGNLITRLDGKISINWNCKFGSHLIRLLLEWKELMLTGWI